MEELMGDLWSCLPSKENEARTVNHRIVQHFQSGLSSEERDVSLHIFFQEDRGISAFMDEVSTSSLKKIASEMFCIFSYLLGNHPTSLYNYVPTIKNISLSFIKRDSSSADEKDKALDVLIALFRTASWDCDLDIPGLISQLQKMSSFRVSKPTVLRKVYVLVGVLAEHFAHFVEEASDRFRNAMLSDLDYQTTSSSKVEFSIIEGCFEGLAGLLCSFPLDEAKHSEELCRRFASYSKKVLEVQNTHRRTAGRAVLNSLARHGYQIRTFLVSEYQEWHKILRSWLALGAEERKIAKQALLTFYSVIASFVSTEINSKDILTFFSTHFKNQFEKSEDVDIAIKGFGLFAKPMNLLTPEEVPKIFNILAQGSQEESVKANNHKSADYLDSLSRLSAELGVIHILQLTILEGLSVQLVSQFALEEHPSWRVVIVDAIICTILRLSKCSGTMLDNYLSTIVHQGLIRTISHPVKQDAEVVIDAVQKKVTTFENYLPLWLDIVSMNLSQRRNAHEGVSLNERTIISAKLLDKILTTVLEIINRLNLSFKENSSSEPIYHCDVEKCIEAENPKDYTVLVNISDFTIALIDGLSDQTNLMKWMNLLIQHVIRLSTKHPLVSSFYKMLSSFILIAQKLGYFDEQKDEMEDIDWRLTVNLLSGFLNDVITRQSQYRGDLQVACLRLMLATPSCIATPLLRICGTAFQSVFHIGCSMLSLAQEGLKTLSCWNQDIPEEKMRPVLKAVLPLLDSLLKTRDNIPDDDDESNLHGMNMVKKMLQDQKKKRLWKHKVHTHVDTELVQIQKEILLFMSTLDSNSCLSLLDGSEEKVGVTSWQKEKLLSFQLPFPDMKVEIHLDDILPRLADLATNCSDRQTRTAACEFLHSVIMFMLGKEKQLETAHIGRLTPLWNHLFPVILHLACDMDLVVSQLFKPLGEQLAHWYSSKTHENSPQAEAYLKSLLDGLTHKTDAALRDYSATCLHEYVEWSRRQGHMLKKVQPLIKFTTSLCLHPCPQKRMGAALAFNSMYTVLRENEQIVNEFWLELLHSLVTGLSVCSITGEDSHTEVQIEKSLQHILRVLIQCSNKFNMDSELRRTPKEFSGGTLRHALCWLLNHCTSLNSKCRHTSMFMVDSLAKYVSGCCSTKDFLLTLFEAEGYSSLLAIAEGKCGLQTSLPKSAPWDKALVWVHSILASMESYIWLKEVNTPSDILFSMGNSNLLKALIHFVDAVAHSPVDQQSLWRPKAIENFNFVKCCTIVRMIEYITVVLDNNHGPTLDLLWASKFLLLIVYCSVWPSHVGFDSTSKNVEENLPITITKFLSTFVHKAPKQAVNELKSLLESHISSSTPAFLERFSAAMKNDMVTLQDRDLMKGLNVLQAVFEETHIWSGLSGTASLQIVFQSITEAVLNSDQNAPVSLGPHALLHATSMLELFFATSSEIQSVIILMIDGTPLYRRGLQGDLTHGEHFVACFEATLVKQLLRKPKESVEILEGLLSPNISPCHLSILPSVLKSHCSRQSTTWSCLQEFISCLFLKWNRFDNWAQANYFKEVWLVSLLNLTVKLQIDFKSVANLETVCSWISKLLTDSTKSLHFKTDLLLCLPIICSSPGNSSTLKKILQDFKDQHFPLQSSEFKKGTEQYLNFVRAFEVLLQSMVISGNCTILQYVVKIMAVDSNHACRHRLPSTLAAFMSRLCSAPNYQLESLTLVFDLFRNEKPDIDVRVRILNEFLLKLMQHASPECQQMFAKTIIRELLNVIGYRVNMKSGTDVEARKKLVSQMGCWHLLQQIYGLPIENFLEGKESKLLDAAFSGIMDVSRGNELTLELTKKAVEVLKCHHDKTNWTGELKETYRLYVCSVFNMFATLICNLKTSPSDVKFYEKFLFDVKSKIIWAELVDDSRCYMLPYEHTEHLKNVEKVVSIRRQVNEEANGGKVDSHKTLRLLESQSFFAGSLEPDMTRFDFTHSRVLNTPRAEAHDERSTIVLESDALNEHECMATVCSIIRHLVDSGISPRPAAGSDPVLPGWMASLKNAMLNKDCPCNSALFILRAILNCETYFYPYAMHLINPVLDCALKYCLRNGISYLLGDIICLLAKWSAQNSVVQIQRSKASALLQFLVKECNSAQRAVFKYHLELIKSVLDVWKEFIDPPYSVLEDKLKSSDKKLGINLTAIMLFYNLSPWTTESKHHFINFLMLNLQESRKEVFKASAETLGLSLNYLSKETGGHLSPEDESILLQLVSCLKNVLRQRDCDRFLTVLNGVHETFPDIVDSFISNILFYLDQTTDDKKALCLTLLANRLQILGDTAYHELKGRGLLNMLSDRNSEVQVKALQIILQLAPDLSEVDMQEVIEKLSAVTCLLKGEARHFAHDISLIAFDHCSSKLASNSLSDTEEKVYNESKALLLLGLVDSNLDLQRKSFTQWTKEERLPSNAPGRLTTMFSLMYSPRTEQHFLSYSVPLMLEGTTCTPDFQSLVFLHALEDCSFEDQLVISDWRVKNAPMAPMFAQTYCGDMSRSGSLASSLNDSSFPLLATQNSFVFQPTMDSVDGQESTPPQTKYSKSLTRSSFLFSQESYHSDYQAMTYKQGAGFGMQRLRLTDKIENEEQLNDSGTLKFKRYLSKNTASRVHAMANVKKANRRNKMWEERARKREGYINTFRKYRTGDFPDIQIKYADFINPLKELAKRDNIVAKQVMVNMFVGVLETVSNSPESDDFHVQTTDLFNEVLEHSENYETPTIGTCLEIAYLRKFRLNPELIAEASQNSDLLALGVLLLETIVHEIDNSEKNWLVLAELYDGLGERDVAHATLLNKLNLGEKSKAALKAHADKQWKTAKKLYFEALDESKYDNFYESCFECMAIMSEWDQINKVIREEVDQSLDNLWEEKWYEKKLLPRLLHSELLKMVQDNRDEHKFLENLNDWLKDDTKGLSLKDRFSEFLAILSLLKGNFPQARFHGSKTLHNFVEDWIELNPLFRKRREVTLMSVQNIAEVMGFFPGKKEVQSEGGCVAFLKKIERVLPVPQDTLMLWETRIHYRMACMDHMPVTMHGRVKEAGLKMQLSLIEAALHQGNQEFAKKYISIVKSKVDVSGPIIKTRWLLAKCWERHQWAEKERNPVRCLDNLLQIWIELDKIVASDDLDENRSLSVSAHSAESKLSFSIKCLLFRESSALTTLQERNRISYDWLFKKLQTDPTNASFEVCDALEKIGLTSLVHAKNIAKGFHNNNPVNSGQTAEAYLQIAQYCHKIIESKEDAPISAVFTKSLVTSTLSAMKHGSNRARQLFPLLLQIPTLSSDHSKDVMEKAAVVPVWMFLKWIPQILALIDTQAADVIGPLLLKIAEKYPNAVSYPYNISREKYVLDLPSKKKMIEQLDLLLENSSLQIQLVRALSCLSYPSIIIKYHIDELSTVIQSALVDWSSVRKICDAVDKEILNGTCGHTGNFFKSIHDDEIHELFQELHAAVLSESKELSCGILNSIKEKLKKVRKLDEKNIKSPSKLKDFSPWLADFSASKIGINIEIPGQYSGDQKPAPERHVMISRFEGTVHVMSSIRRPVKLTIIGSDAISRNFLIKFGEDLRQDERVQQLLGLMNGIFMNNHCCRERQLSVYTYKVVPLSCKLGMIEWVDDTSSLRELMLSSLSEEEKISLNNAALKHYEWLGNPGSNPKTVYGRAHQLIAKNNATTAFSKTLARIKQDALRKGLVMWSSSAESFYWLRHSFITSYSTLCVAHWLLGVGDRHLNNCLVSQKNGQCIGIDFGHVFGSATQFLPVHELVPFRLTPQIVNVVQPFSTTGLIEETMVNAWRALQSDPEVLVSTMQVFIQEPSLDWLLLARRHFLENDDDPSWLPAVKIQQANRKLRGVNPVKIVKEDLQNSSFSEFTEAYCRTSMGKAPENIRASLPEDGLTAREQIKCLIDLATDYDVLAKTFHGWEPWM